MQQPGITFLTNTVHASYPIIVERMSTSAIDINDIYKNAGFTIKPYTFTYPIEGSEEDGKYTYHEFHCIHCNIAISGDVFIALRDTSQSDRRCPNCGYAFSQHLVMTADDWDGIYNRYIYLSNNDLCMLMTNDNYDDYDNIYNYTRYDTYIYNNTNSSTFDTFIPTAKQPQERVPALNKEFLDKCPTVPQSHI